MTKAIEKKREKQRYISPSIFSETGSDKYHIEYKKRFGKETSIGGGSGYDAAKMYIQAAEQAENVNDYLHGIKEFHGAFGIYNATPAHDFDFNAVVKEVKKEGFVKVEEK